MEYVAIVIGLVGLVMAWSARRKTNELKERLAQANSRSYRLRREAQEAQEKTEQELMRLKFELLKLQGNLQITPDMRVGELLMMHPQAQQVLAAFHIGGCSSCSVDDRQTLGEAIAVNGREPEPVLAALNTLVVENDAAGDNGHAPDPLRMPNVELHF